LSLEVLFLFRSSSLFAITLSLCPLSYFPVIPLYCSFVDKSETPIEIEKQNTEVDKMSKVMKFLIIWKTPLGNVVCASNRSGLFSGFNFTTAQVVCITAMINHKFVSFRSSRLVELQFSVSISFKENYIFKAFIGPSSLQFPLFYYSVY